MSERFYFDLVSGTTIIRDDVGTPAESLEEAITQAQSVIVEMSLKGEIPDDEETWELVIRDESGLEQRRLSIKS